MLAGLLDDVHQRGAALVLRGEPGIGKSALLAKAVRAAAGKNIQVLSTSGVHSEANLPFAGLHQLLRPILAHLDDLPARQRTALGAAFGMEDAATPEPFLIALAVLQLLSEASAQDPMLLVAEDAHWLDRPTADVLAFIARRVESDPIVVLAAIRDGYDSPLLAAGLPELHLERLGPGPARELLDARFPRLAPAIRTRVLAEAEGNPLALLELPAALGSGVRNGSSAMPDRLPLTERLERAFASRAAELPRVTQTLLLVAAADDSFPLALVMKATEIVLGTAPAVGDVVPAVRARLTELDGQIIGFRHPLVRSAIYQAASVAERHAAHAALAEVLADDQDRRVWHRAAAAVGTDPAVAAELEEAARRAVRRGAIITAAAAFERAAALAADPARRGVLLLSAAEAARELGQTEMVVRLLRQANAYPLTSYDRARAMWLGDAFGEVPVGDPARVHALVETARRVIGEKRTRLALNLLSAAGFRCYCADLGDSAVAEVLDAADLAGASPADPQLLQIQAYAAPINRGAAVLGRLAHVVPSDDPEVSYLLGTAACQAGEFHRSCALLDASAAGLREQGRLRTLAHVLTTRAWAGIMIADFRVAMPAAEEAGRLAAETAQPLWQAGAWTAQAALAALRGEHASVNDLTARVEEIMLPVGAAEALSHVQYTRGLLALGQGRHMEAYAQLSRMYEPGDPAHVVRMLCGSIGFLAEAAVHSDRRDHARAIMQQLEPLAKQTPSPWIHMSMLEARALLADDEEAEAIYGEALSCDPSLWPFMRARVQLAFGEWLRRQRRIADSRAPLRAARDAFDALGTTPWSERARRELRASGENSHRRAPGTIEQLTPQELQIIQLASEGLSNREIGQRLYLSHRTVESHLYRVFPKLGITSRSQLGTVLGGPAEPAPA